MNEEKFINLNHKVENFTAELLLSAFGQEKEILSRGKNTIILVGCTLDLVLMLPPDANNGVPEAVILSLKASSSALCFSASLTIRCMSSLESFLSDLENLTFSIPIFAQFPTHHYTIFERKPNFDQIGCFL